jgi:hypothetical protein
MDEKESEKYREAVIALGAKIQERQDALQQVLRRIGIEDEKQADLIAERLLAEHVIVDADDAWCGDDHALLTFFRYWCAVTSEHHETMQAEPDFWDRPIPGRNAN